jgi:hypothetical protein
MMLSSWIGPVSVKYTRVFCENPESSHFESKYNLGILHLYIYSWSSVGLGHIDGRY